MCVACRHAPNRHKSSCPLFEVNPVLWVLWVLWDPDPIRKAWKQGQGVVSVGLLDVCQGAFHRGWTYQRPRSGPQSHGTRPHQFKQVQLASRQLTQAGRPHVGWQREAARQLGKCDSSTLPRCQRVGWHRGEIPPAPPHPISPQPSAPQSVTSLCHIFPT